MPFRAPLAVIASFSLIPLVGATIAAVLVGLVTLFKDFPTATIIWVDLGDRLPAVREQPDPAPDPEARGATCSPSLIVAVLFGATLLGVLGALVAVPVAASIQILLREYVDLRTLSIRPEPPGPPRRTPPAPPAGDRPPA